MAPTPESNGIGEDPNDLDMITKIKEIPRLNRINSPISNVIVNDSGLKGENYASQTHLITVKFEDTKIEPLNLFVKRQMENPSHTAFVEEAKVFQKEAQFFMSYLPQAREFCKSKGKEDLMDIYPKCYYGDSKMIVFENLVVTKGYTMLDKEERQDFDSARVAITSLAKHHAISYAFIRQSGGPQEFFQRFPYLNFECLKGDNVRAMMEPTLENGLLVNANIVDKFGEDGKQEAISLMKAHKGKTFDALLNALKEDPEVESFRVLNHGDYWNNNMMFLVDSGTGKVTGHKAVDLQCTRYCSPTLDLGNFLFTSVQHVVRQSRLRELLKVYLEALQSVTKDLGCPIPLTFDQLFADFRKKFMYGYWIGITFFSSASLAVFKDIDPSKIEMSQFGTIFLQLVEKWIEKNPEKSEKGARELIGIAKEYNELSLCYNNSNNNVY